MNNLLTWRLNPLPLVLWLCTLSGSHWILNLQSSFGIHAITILLLGGYALIQGGVRIKRPHLRNFALIVTLIYGHLLLASLVGPCTDALFRAFGGATALTVILFMIFIIADKGIPFDVFLTLKRVVAFVTMTVVLNFTYNVAVATSYMSRASGIFSEPSHLALFVAPLLALLMVSKVRADRNVAYMVAVMLLVLSASSTLIIMLIVCSLALRLAAATGDKLKSILKSILFALTVLGLTAFTPYWSEFTQRLEGLGGLDEGNNLSSLVYLNGWLMANENFFNSYGIGLGINRMGCRPLPQTAISDMLIMGESSDALPFNYNDGSFLASKLISETGIFFVVIVLGFLWALRGHVRNYRRAPSGFSKDIALLCISLLASATVGMFIRGSGYFSPSFLLGLYSICLLVRSPWAASAPSVRRS